MLQAHFLIFFNKAQVAENDREKEMANLERIVKNIVKINKNFPQEKVTVS